jgi:hypothetical protein
MTKERELLRRVQAFLDKGDLTGEALRLSIAVDEFLSTPSDDADEPVAWKSLTDEELREIEKVFHAERVRTSDEEYLVIYPADYWDWQRAIEKAMREKNHPPKPAEPAARKPLNGDQILEGFNATGFTNTDYRLRCFIEGVRFAEKHHGITNES